MSWCWRRAAVLGAMSVALTTGGCAEERDPINRVQANALAKSFFVGANLLDTADDPEFWSQTSLVEAPYGVSQGWLFPSSWTQKLSRIKWQVTEDLLLGRLTYEYIEDADGRGAAGAADNDGTVIYAYRILNHFDIRRAYNPSTGEEMNVIEENSSDRPWYEREYFRVDWSENLQTDVYDFDVLSMNGLDGVKYSPLAYYVNDPSDPDAPYFDTETGYFDVTNKAFATPQVLDLSSLGWGIAAFPACWLPDEFAGGTYPSANCNPTELTMRQSFRRVVDTDFEPMDYDGYRFQAYGGFTVERFGYDRNYGMIDAKWRRMLSRYNIWERSHYYDNPDEMTGEIPCFTEQTTPYGADPNRDDNHDGTADECALVTVKLAEQAGACAPGGDAGQCYADNRLHFGGSQCDPFKKRCTLPFRARQEKTVPFHLTVPGDLEYWDGTSWAVHEWDVAMRYSVMVARYGECRASGGDKETCLVGNKVFFRQMDDQQEANRLAQEVDDCRHGETYPDAGAVNSQQREDFCVGLVDTVAAARNAATSGGAEPMIDEGVMALARMPEMIVLCHSPVEANDPAICAPADRRLPPDVSAADCEEAEQTRDASLLPICRAAVHARRGDLRYHMVNNFHEPHSPSSWGIMTDSEDPVTSETVASTVTVWTYINDVWTQGVMDRLRFIKGELAVEDVTDAQYVVDYANAAEAAQRGGVFGHFTRDTLRQRQAAMANVTPQELEELMASPDPEMIARGRELKAQLQGVKAHVSATTTSAPIYEARRQQAIGTEVEASLMTPGIQRAAGVEGLPLSSEVMNYASPLRGMHPGLARQMRQLREAAVTRRGACILEEAPAPVSVVSLGTTLEEKFANVCLTSDDLTSLCMHRGEFDQQATKFGNDAEAAFQTVCVRGEALPAEQCIKYGTFNATDSKGMQNIRAERMRTYMKQRVHMSVIVHEMGHSMAHRHNFVSSSDAFSFRPQYWQLRTRNGAVTRRCGCEEGGTPMPNQNPRACENYEADGSACVGPRYFDPMTEEEDRGLIWMWQQSSIMDYAGEYTQDLIGIGMWDIAANAMFYGDTVAVFDDPSYRVGEDRASGMLAKMDNFGGILGIQPMFDGNDVHYSTLNNHYEMISDCRPVTDVMAYRPASWNDARDGAWHPLLDGFIVNVNGEYSKCHTQKVDYVPWRMLHKPEGSELRDVSYYRAGNSVDDQGRIRIPYGFATDSWADLGNASVYRHDNGADVYEIFEWLATQQEINHIFDNYRRGKLDFSVRARANRTLGRYNEKIRDGAKGLGLMFNVYRDFAAENNWVFEGGMAAFMSAWWFPDNVVASGLVFDQFVRTAVRPESGQHYRERIGSDYVMRSAEDTMAYEFDVTAIIPDGATGKFGLNVSPGGKIIESRLCEECGEYDSSYTMNCGSYYDKVNAAYLMTESVDNFISDSRDDFVDARYRAVSLADVFPAGYQRWLGNMLTGDEFAKGPRLAGDGSHYPLVDENLVPTWPMGWPSYWPESGAEVCWPASGTTVCGAIGLNPDAFGADPPESVLPIDSQVGWETQKFLINWTMLYLPENQKQKWINQLWIWEVGQDADPEFGNRIEFHDPSGKVFVAKTYGKECLFGTGTTRDDCEDSGGKWVQKGISARVLEYANSLLAKAYVVTDGPDLDADGVPDWYVPDTSTGVAAVAYDSDMDFWTAGGSLVGSIPGCNATENYACTCSANKACVKLEKYVTVPFYIRQTMVAYGIVDPSMIGLFDF